MKAKKEKTKKSTITNQPETAPPKRKKYHFPVLKRTVEAESYAEALKIINNK
jgi:hypothetical protein